MTDERRRHPIDACVRPDGMRDLTMEMFTHREGDIVRIKNRCAEGVPVVAQLDLTPQSLDFLIDALPSGDAFVEQLRYARQLAQDALWNKTVDR